MFGRMRKHFAPPVFEDEDRTRTASLLNVILLVIFVASLALTLIAGLISATAPQSLITGGVTAILALVIWLTMRRGHIQLASVLFLFDLLISTTLAVYFAGTIRAPIATVYILCIVIAGLLIGIRGAAIFSLLSLLALLGLLHFETAGLVSAVQAPTGITHWLTYVATFSVTAVLLGLAVRSIDQALERARRNERALVEANEALRREIVERKQAEEALRRYAERLEALREIDQAILEVWSSEEIAQAALHRIRQLVPCQRTSMVLFDQGANEGTVLASDFDGETGLGAGKHLSLEEFGGIEDLRQGTVRVIEDALTCPQWPSARQVLYAEGLRSFVSVPLIFRGRLIGSLNLGASSPGVISLEHIRIAREVADQLAIAIQNVQLLEAERRRSAELEALRQASLHVTSSLELQPVLEAILEHAVRLVSADDARIFLYDGERLTFGAAIWAGVAQREPYAEPRPEGLTYAVVRSGEQIVIADVDAHPLFRAWEWGGAVVGLPLRIGDEVRGVMNIAFEKPHVFSESELNVLGLLADQAAIAIHNARLHQDVRRQAKELAAALAWQEELDRLKGEFIQNVSHELRSPLALIRGYAEMLNEGDLGDLLPEQRQSVSIITRRSQMLSDLVEDITLFLEAEARPLERKPVALDELVYVAVEDFCVAADQAGLKLEAEIARDLLPVGGSLVYLRRVLDNLLSNAVKFTPAGGTVTVRVWREGDQVALEVRDTGIGIASDQLGRIFERFYQVDGSVRRKYGGVGLGLALVKEIVDLHGGQVMVESCVGKGSAFTVTLPVLEG